MWWILAVYVALSALMLWFLYRTGNFPGGAPDDRADFEPPKRAEPRARNKLAAR